MGTYDVLKSWAVWETKTHHIYRRQRLIGALCFIYTFLKLKIGHTMRYDDNVHIVIYIFYQMGNFRAKTPPK